MTPAARRAQQLRTLADRLDKLGHSGGQVCREAAELIEAQGEMAEWAWHSDLCVGTDDDCNCGYEALSARLAEVEGRVNPLEG